MCSYMHAHSPHVGSLGYTGINCQMLAPTTFKIFRHLWTQLACCRAVKLASIQLIITITTVNVLHKIHLNIHRNKLCDARIIYTSINCQFSHYYHQHNVSVYHWGTLLVQISLFVQFIGTCLNIKYSTYIKYGFLHDHH